MRRSKQISSWISLRGELSIQALQNVRMNVWNAAPIIVGLMGPLLLGLVAMLAAPLLYAVTLPAPEGFAIFVVHTLIASIPLFMLRQRVLPDSLLAWEAGLPVQPRHRIIGDARATTVLVAPLFGAYLVSSLVWFWQWPPWLRPVWATGAVAVLASTLATWLAGMLLLSLRSRSSLASHRRSGSVRSQSTGLTWKLPAYRWSRAFAVAHDLLLKPIWRRNALVWRAGHPALIVLTAACLLAMPLLPPGAFTWQSVLATLSALLYVAVVLWRDALMQSNLAHLAREIAGWPVSFGHLNAVSRTWALLPTALLSFVPFGVILLNASSRSFSAPLWFAGIGLVGAPTMLAATQTWSRNRWMAAVVLVVALAISGDFL
ncbi:MAG: hypothetical protein HY066_15345 [Betaproteobacteria bacterium]|nr:hypothetical protein [Betaproteobacteria bacterium]